MAANYSHRHIAEVVTQMTGIAWATWSERLNKRLFDKLYCQ